MSKVLIIGCGGVASVAIHKCCQVPEVFTEICIASRTKSKCDKLAAELAPKTATKITTAQVDADKVDEVIALIKAYQPDLVMNIALPYQDLTIMDACLACGVNYMDTANYEPENSQHGYGGYGKTASPVLCSHLHRPAAGSVCSVVLHGHPEPGHGLTISDSLNLRLYLNHLFSMMRRGSKSVLPHTHLAVL